jgi:hypothetical protein
VRVRHASRQLRGGTAYLALERAGVCLGLQRFNYLDTCLIERSGPFPLQFTNITCRRRTLNCLNVSDALDGIRATD